MPGSWDKEMYYNNKRKLLKKTVNVSSWLKIEIKIDKFAII